MEASAPAPDTVPFEAAVIPPRWSVAGWLMDAVGSPRSRGYEDMP